MIELIRYLPLILIGAALVLCVIRYRKGLKAYAAQLLLCLVRTAEDSYGEGMGTFKYAAVASLLYERMPALFRLLFSERQISILIEAAVSAMKLTLSERMTEEAPKRAEEG